MRSLPAGHILGIPVSIHPAVGVLAAVLILQQGLLVDRGGQGFALATVLVLLLFVSVILHEIGHAVMARHFGLTVSDISLSPIGGVVRIERLPQQSPVETLVALAGPLVNLAIAVALVPLLVVLGFVAGYSSLGELLTNAFTGTGPIALLVSFLLLNVLLLVFNLLPAFPMDGGRIFRALLAGRFGREQGTRIAVVTGQALGVAIIVAAIVWQLWVLIPVGIFVAIAAQAEWRDVQVEQALRRYRVGPYALWDSGGLAPNRPLTFALRGGPRDCVVTQNGRVIGMVWRHQLLHALHGGAGQRTVADIMDTDIVAADVDDSLHDVEQWMHETNRWAIPVTEAGLYRGIFTADRFVHIRRRLSGNAWDPRDFGAALLGRVRQGLRGETR
ncbi:MAG TPA: site-2 protease family protein [Thermomicrobiales bacterium]|jgi:Zn-dependent protease|nr:site-2 protease family protein [Thermomicrobiales bacterium]